MAIPGNHNLAETSDSGSLQNADDELFHATVMVCNAVIRSATL